MNKAAKVFLVVLLCLVTCGASYAAGAVPYMGYIRVAVSGTNVNLRDQPSAKGRVLGQVRYEYGHVISSNGEENFLEDAGFIAESEPITDSSDNSTWYKLVFYVDNFNGDVHRLDKDARFSYKTPYVSGRYLNYMDVDDYDKWQIDYFVQGRPLRYRTGDVVNNVVIGPDADAVFVTKKPVLMYLEPEQDARRQELPAGSKVVIYNGPGFGGPSYNSDEGTLYYHMDMDDVTWTPVIGEDKRIIGWTQYSDVPEGWIR